jgi:trk system potassium uptake protein TrkH
LLRCVHLPDDQYRWYGRLGEVAVVSFRIDWRATASLLGRIVKYLSMTMVVPLAVAVLYGEQSAAGIFLGSLVIAALLGLTLERLDPDPDLGPREALVLVSLAWLAAAVLGAIPFLLAGTFVTPASTLGQPINALFESMSGFTTTGSTVLVNIEQHSRSVLLWRQLIQWLGGMGIIVLMIAILPELAVNGAQLMQSEAPGPKLQKLTPKIAETARALWLIYGLLTALYICLLYALHLFELAPEMHLYNAIAHGLSTLPTGGFSPEADSIATFSPAVQWLVTIFVIAAGVNFALFWHVLRDEARLAFENPELRTYLGAVVGLSAVVSVLLVLGAGDPQARGGVTSGLSENAIRQAVFQVSSLLNSTGFATANYVTWDTNVKFVLLIVMFVGGSAGSTGGGIKIIRWLVTLKAIRRELHTTARPEVVSPVRLAGEVVDEDAVRAILAFTLLYVLLFVLSAAFFVIDSARAASIEGQLTVLEAMGASIATLGNLGPGFGPLGPFGTFDSLSDASKLLMILLMWLGRLEIVPVLAVLVGGLDDR